ncbi:MAG: bacillithiol biosynthesis deacetylase BshB1 [Deltaproteobacteria bacterium]|nr:bacillithiol biosynthesis deacetylase BshB1 [Deltaproteobacteria bacterium]
MKNGFDLGILAIGAHPDDIELSCGGFLAKMGDLGHKTGVLDLTEGELGSRGTVEERRREADAASKILGLSYREILTFPDGGVETGENPTSPQLLALVEKLRTLRPEIVVAPYFQERHPDHVAASRLVTRAVFCAGLKKFAPQLGTEHLPRQVLYYQMRFDLEPAFITDITAYEAKKAAAIQCCSSQVTPNSNLTSGPVLIASPLSLLALQARDRYFGAKIGVALGEAFHMRNIVSIDDPLSHFRQHDVRGALFFPGEF